MYPATAIVVADRPLKTTAILCDNRVAYFPMSGKAFSSCSSDMIFRQRLDLGEIGRFYSLQNFEIYLRKKSYG